jgi:uncharacterized damage-inducible protein DinB
MNAQAVVASLQSMKTFFDTGTKCFEEKDSTFAAVPGTFTVAQHVAHVAHTIDWFVEGAFRPQGFDLDFAGQEARVRGISKLSEARAWWERSMAEAVRVLGSKTEAELAVPLPEDGIMGGVPRFAIVSGMTDHTAHHRGALAVYARLLGKVPPMPYGA